MTIAILRIALTDHGGKWVPGTILNVYQPDATLGAGIVAGAHCEKVSSANYSFADFQAMKKAKVLDLNELMEPELLLAKVEQKLNFQEALEVVDGPAENLDKLGFVLPDSYKRQGVVIQVSELAIKPDLEKITDFDSLTLSDMPEEYRKPLIEVVGEEMLEGLGRR